MLEVSRCVATITSRHTAAPRPGQKTVEGVILEENALGTENSCRRVVPEKKDGADSERGEVLVERSPRRFHCIGTNKGAPSKLSLGGKARAHLLYMI